MKSASNVARFWQSVGVVLSGAAVAQAIPLLGTVVIARLYLPEEYGLFAAWLGVASLAAVAVTGRFEIALALEADGEPRRLAMVATLITICIACLALVVALLFAAVLLPSKLDHQSVWLLGIPGVPLVAASQTWQAWAAAEGRYRDLSVIRITQSATITVVQIGVGTWSPSATSLAMAYVIGVGSGLLAASLLLPLTFRDMSVRAWRRVVLSFWARRRRFPLLSLPADSVNTAAAQLPLLIVSSRFGAEVAGWLALTMRMLGGPISLLGATVLDVFRRHAALSWREHGECRDDYLQTLRVLGGGSLIFVLVMASSSVALFTAVFGEQWRMSGTIALWMLPMFAMRFVASPLSYMFYVAGKQHVDLVWQVALLGMTVSALTIAEQYDSALQIYSAGYSLMYVFYLYLSYQFSCGQSE